MSQVQEKRTTICIPTFNQSQYVLQAISSALAQTSPVEVYVSNDGSTDDTAAVLDTVDLNGSVKIVSHSINRGIGRNVKWLLKRPTTELIARLDSDDSLDPSYVDVLSKLLDAYPKAGYAHCAVEEIDDAGRPGRIRRLARKTGYEDAESSLHNMVLGYKVAANIILFRREALVSAGFGADTLNFAEDYDLCVRIADAGWGNVYSDQVHASYRVWGAPSRQSVFRKISEIQGLCHVYSVSLEGAFLKRDWSVRALTWRRIELALAHSAYFDKGTLSDSHWKSLQMELVKLTGLAWTSVLFERKGWGRWIRHALVRLLHFKGLLTRWAKKAIRNR
jgi:glycosyltransferase involved in cell wall biosynthesis